VKTFFTLKWFIKLD